MNWCARLARMFAAALFAVLAIGAPAAAPGFTETHAAVGYTYDAPTYDAPENYTAPERGPPVNGDVNTTDDAVGLRSHGTSARPESTSTPDHQTTYDASARLAQITLATGTTQTRVHGDAGASVALAPLQAAANAAARTPGVIRVGELKLPGVPKGVTGTPTIREARRKSIHVWPASGWWPRGSTNTRTATSRT